MEGSHQKDSSTITIPYSCKNDLKVVKDVGLELIDIIISEDFEDTQASSDIIRNYKKRLQIFHKNLIKNIKDHIHLSKSADYDSHKEVTEYSEIDEKLGFENNKLLSELFHIIEQNRNNKQFVIEQIKSKVKHDFEKYNQQNTENANMNSFDIICVEGENYSKAITKERFLKSFQENYSNKLKHTLECHKVSFENFEAIYNSRKHLFLNIGQKQNELLSNLNGINFDLSAEERVLFDQD